MSLKQIICLFTLTFLFSFNQSFSLPYKIKKSGFIVKSIKHVEKSTSVYFAKFTKFVKVNNLFTLTPKLKWYQLNNYYKIFILITLGLTENIVAYYWLKYRLESQILRDILVFHVRNPDLTKYIISKEQLITGPSKTRVVKGQKYYITTEPKYLKILARIYKQVTLRIKWYSPLFSVQSHRSKMLEFINFLNVICKVHLKYLTSQSILLIHLVCQCINLFFERSHVVSNLLDLCFIALVIAHITSILLWNFVYSRKLYHLYPNLISETILRPILTSILSPEEPLPAHIDYDRLNSGWINWFL